jgi:hypothetical protein
VLGEHLFEAGDALLHVVMRRAHLILAMQRFHQPQRGAEQRHHEAGVAAAGAEADRLAFEHGDLERGFGSLEVIGGRQSRVPGADDRDVDRDVARQGRRNGARLLAAVPIVGDARLLCGHSIARGFKVRCVDDTEAAVRAQV